MLCSVSRGIGELDVNKPVVSSESSVIVSDDLPYLLLDVREKDEYDALHIRTGTYGC